MDSQAQLAEYKLQLQQVEAALTTDPENEDLKKLQNDLTEVINLTEDLILSQAAEESTADDVAGPSAASTSSSHATHWRVGDRCMALYAEDEAYYEATIDEIMDNGSCTVTFDEYGNTEITQVSLLQPHVESMKRKGEEESLGQPETKTFMSKRDQINAQKEYKRKKNLKKQMRMKALDEEREADKNKWLAFNAKTFGKTSKGKVKKSIFATPDAASGRVGVGTCGVGGQKMTQYSHAQKWKKN